MYFVDVVSCAAASDECFVYSRFIIFYIGRHVVGGDRERVAESLQKENAGRILGMFRLAAVCVGGFSFCFGKIGCLSGGTAKGFFGAGREQLGLSDDEGGGIS